MLSQPDVHQVFWLGECSCVEPLGGKLEGFWHLGCIKLLLHSRLQILACKPSWYACLSFPACPYPASISLLCKDEALLMHFSKGLQGTLLLAAELGTLLTHRSLGIRYASSVSGQQDWIQLCCSGGIWAQHWGKSWAVGVVLCHGVMDWEPPLHPGSSTPGVRVQQTGVLDSLCHWTEAWKFGFNPLLQISWSCQHNAHSSMYSSFLVAVYVAKGTAGSRSSACS